MGVDSESVLAEQVVGLLIGGLKDADGRVHAEDLISASAAIVGERCIEAAGDFNPREHEFAPGSHVFSDAVNDLLCGNVSTRLEDCPADSVFGRLRDELLTNGYNRSDFPDIESVFRSYAGGIRKPEDWGWVPLSVGENNRPFLMPLRVAYETRAAVDEIFKPFQRDRRRCLAVATRALAQVLTLIRDAIQPAVALRIAFETANGMAKTAPMTQQAFSKVAAEVFGSNPQKPQKPWWRFW